MVSLEDMIKEEMNQDKKKDKDKDKDKPTTGEGILKKIWDAESPKKSLSSYSEHSLNWDGKDSTGKIIRGLEGLFTNLDRAVIDVVAGAFQKIGELVKGMGKKEEQRG